MRPFVMKQGQGASHGALVRLCIEALFPCPPSFYKRFRPLEPAQIHRRES